MVTANRPTTDETSKEKKTNKMLGTLPESGHQISSTIQSVSRGRPEYSSTTSGVGPKEGYDYKDHRNREFKFREALKKYKAMLETIRDDRCRLKTKDKTPLSLLKEEEADKFRQQFEHVRRNRSDNSCETTEWSSVEVCHGKLMKLVFTEAEGQRFAKISEQAKDIVEDVLRKLEAIG